MRLIFPILTACAISFSLCACDSGGKLHNTEAGIQGGSSEDNLQIAMTPDVIAHGRDLYLSSCSACHGATGQGNGPAAAALATKPRDHTNGAYMDKLSNSHIFKTIKFGGSMYGYPTMPAQPNLSDDDVKSLVAYVRTLSNTYKKP